MSDESWVVNVADDRQMTIAVVVSDRSLAFVQNGFAAGEVICVNSYSWNGCLKYCLPGKHFPMSDCADHNHYSILPLTHR